MSASEIKDFAEPKSSRGIPGVMCARVLLLDLWGRCADTMTADELASVHSGVDNAATDLLLLSETVSSVATLANSDLGTKGNIAGSLDDASNFLYSIANQIETLTAMIEIGDDAIGRLIRRSGYKDSAATKGGAE